MNMMTRGQTEDFFHDVISLMVPSIDKSNIRPAFQKTKQPNMAGKNYISYGDDINNGLEGFSNTDDFIYFRVNFDTIENNQSEVTPEDKVSIVRDVELTVYIYGDNAANNALRIKSLLRSQKIVDYLNRHGYYQTSEGYITPLFEEINEEWWERSDLSVHFGCSVEINPDDRPNDWALGYNKGLPVPSIVVNGEKR